MTQNWESGSGRAGGETIVWLRQNARGLWPCPVQLWTQGAPPADRPRQRWQQSCGGCRERRGPARTYCASTGISTPSDVAASPPLWPFWAPDPDEFYRWRVQLECDCITEVLTSGPDRRPDNAQWPDRVNGARLPTGQILCVHEDPPLTPYREIAARGRPAGAYVSRRPGRPTRLGQRGNVGRDTS